jgi:hypothetical protein
MGHWHEGPRQFKLFNKNFKLFHASKYKTNALQCSKNTQSMRLDLNFKGVQTLWEKYGKVTKNLSGHDLHKSEISLAHLYAGYWSSNISVKMA